MTLPEVVPTEMQIDRMEVAVQFPSRWPVAFRAIRWSAICLFTVFIAPSSENIGLSFQTQGANTSPSQVRNLEQAQRLMDRKDYSGAARIYEQILGAYPNSFQALSNLGVADAQLGKYSEAARAYGRALKIQPNSFPLLLNLGLCYFKSEDYRSAVKPLRHAVVIQPDNFQARSLLAMSYYSQKDFTPASREFEKLIAAKPDNPTLQYLLAESYLWSGQEQQMLDFFRHVLEKSPNSVTVHMLMGEADDGLGRTDEAIKEFEAAAALAPQQPNVHFGLGYLYWESRQFDRAAIEFQREIDAGGSVAKSQVYLGDIALHQGNLARARTYLVEAARLYPQYRFTHYDLGVLETKEKNYDGAVSELRKAIELDSKRADAHYRLAEVFRAQGKTKLAQEELDKVAQIQAGTRENLLHEISGSPPQAPEP